jgi:hypothetical protein
LQRLPKKQALQNLAAIIATLSDEPRSPGKSQALADQLIELLPPRPSFSMRFAAHRRGLWAHLARHLPRSISFVARYDPVQMPPSFDDGGGAIIRAVERRSMRSR